MASRHCQRRSRNHPAYADKLKAGEERNEIWRSVSNSTKVAVLKKRRGFSKRQQAKLANIS